MTFRNLALIKHSGSTSRILNLHVVHERFGKTEAYNEKPLFISKRLNRSLIVKHALRGADRYLLETPKATATKIILPFSNDDLGVGGTNIFVGQRNFANALRELAGGYKDDTELKKDLELLTALDKLPSLDPFLVRERLRVMQRSPAQCYFQISDADLRNMQEFVGSQVNGLVEMALQNGVAGVGTREVCAQMAAKILSDENAESLAPLRAALGLAGQEWADGVFCWKGFLYYKWVFNKIMSSAAATVKQMRQVNLSKCDPATARTIIEMRDRAIAVVQDRLKSMRDMLQTYDTAYKSMTADGNPSAFKDFLLRSPATFLEIGETSGILDHLAGFWEFRCGRSGASVAALDGEALIELFQEFENCRNLGNASSSEVSWHAATG
ncbi:MAG: hypothetical protein GC190_17490 [Alphaproteobacteria bacterium]|nr:hypothetical protein [Alphaproteobacteria bacterium]